MIGWLEIKWAGITWLDYWRNEQFFMIGSTSAYPAAVLHMAVNLLTKKGIHFRVTSKQTAADDNDKYADLYDFRWVPMLFPSVVVLMFNVGAIGVALGKTVWDLQLSYLSRRPRSPSLVHRRTAHLRPLLTHGIGPPPMLALPPSLLPCSREELHPNKSHHLGPHRAGGHRCRAILVGRVGGRRRLLGPRHRHVMPFLGRTERLEPVWTHKAVHASSRWVEDRSIGDGPRGRRSGGGGGWE
ncbi:hypothetical protein PR202_gb21195 [Eleusine coracana subsp. coracana]|uniref:Uncharacterized protein n=1 Tax=Eleusine coracana subsp. coracana TaxID=191504 RepID=A0AAV5FCN3_ELECO|nr:hypothetical protein PR202_gb21195 [Eleusine coracana subsp. coracana]